MEIHLTSDMEKLVKSKVEAGLYCSVSDAVNQSLRLLDDYDELRKIREEKLKAEVMIGIEQLERGEGIDGEVAFARLEAHMNKVEGKI